MGLFTKDFIKLVLEFLVPEEPNTETATNEYIRNILFQNKQFEMLNKIVHWEKLLPLHNADHYDCVNTPLTFYDDTILTPNIQSFFVFDLDEKVCHKKIYHWSLILL